MSGGKPLPDTDSEPHSTFWAACSDERLLIQACPDCGKRQFFPRSWCHFCGAGDVEWIEADGTGRVHAYTVIRRATEIPAFADDVPYTVAYVELDEGVRICSNIVACDPDDVEIGLPVEVTFDHVTADVALPKFRPQDG